MQRLTPAFSLRAAQALAGLPAAERPALWLGDRWAQTSTPAAVCPTGFAALDAELPGGGWPAAGLTELLLEAPGSGELRLLAPLLLSFSQGNAGPPQISLLPLGGADAARRPWGRSQGNAGPPQVSLLPLGGADAARRPWGRSGRQTRRAGSLLCISPPFIAYAPALRALSLPLERLLFVTPETLADAAWAAEQGLRSGACAAVLWWQGLGAGAAGLMGSAGSAGSAKRSSGAPLATVLRRLHLAAQESACPVFALRPASARGQSSPAPLRLMLEPQAQGQLAVSVFKRRGPAMAAPLWLTLPVAGLPVRRTLRRAEAPPALPAPPVVPLPEPADVVVRTASLRLAA